MAASVTSREVSLYVDLPAEKSKNKGSQVKYRGAVRTWCYLFYTVVKDNVGIEIIG